MKSLTLLLLGAALAEEPQDINLTTRTSFNLKDLSQNKLPKRFRITSPTILNLNYFPENNSFRYEDLNYLTENHSLNISPSISINQYSSLNENMYPGIRSEPRVIYLEYKF
ncbi:hypothetical protein HN681_01295 [archaeon]|jgi:hypothetical protein|nr:hypothetical protein [archaeon]MBT3730691.1 hypothetical protein [archaeon]MBT4669593.1 hypothetical protein [archaeon]MBT5030350.1 hypothetical protein [archaeon]MBT5288357.1 hypothetical protein [archaeon]